MCLFCATLLIETYYRRTFTEPCRGTVQDGVVPLTMQLVVGLHPALEYTICFHTADGNSLTFYQCNAVPECRNLGLVFRV